MRLLSIEAAFRRQTSPMPSPAAWAVASATRFRNPATASKKLAISSAVRTGGSFSGSRPLTMRSNASCRPSVKPQRASGLIYVRPGALLCDQIHLVSADVLDAEPVRRFSKMAAEFSDRMDVRLLRRRREVADRHVFDHALAKRLVVAIEASCPERGRCDDHILSDTGFHRSDLPAAPKEQVRSMAAHDPVGRALSIRGMRIAPR